jgi:hypothetical protein
MVRSVCGPPALSIHLSSGIPDHISLFENAILNVVLVIPRHDRYGLTRKGVFI